MTIIQEIKNILDSSEFSSNLRNLNHLLCNETLIPEVTCWGGRVLRVQGTRESIPLRKIANKFAETVFEATEQTDRYIYRLMQMNKQDREEAVKQRPEPSIDFEIAESLSINLFVRYQTIKHQIAQSGFFVRILAAIRQYFPSEYTALCHTYYIYDNAAFLKYGTLDESLRNHYLEIKDHRYPKW